MFLSGAWADDGDSDAFNQIFYSQSTNGEDWSTPTPVISTDYSFSASYNQDNNVNGDGTQPIGISAYYEGRAYGASVVQNPNGTLTMVFAGYRFPKSIATSGDVLGTASPQWTVGPNDLTMYRNILTTTLSESTSPAVSDHRLPDDASDLARGRGPNRDGHGHRGARVARDGDAHRHRLVLGRGRNAALHRHPRPVHP